MQTTTTRPIENGFQDVSLPKLGRPFESLRVMVRHHATSVMPRQAYRKAADGSEERCPVGWQDLGSVGWHGFAVAMAEWTMAALAMDATVLVVHEGPTGIRTGHAWVPATGA